MPFPDMQSNGREQHPDEGMLHEWIEEQLGTDDAARVAAHVATCAECRERVAEAHGLIAASRRILGTLDDVPAGVIPTAPSARLAAAPRVASMAAASVVSAHGAAAHGAAVHGAATQPAIVATARQFRWRRWGAAAAVLLLTISGVVVTRSGDMVHNEALVRASRALPDASRDSVRGAPRDTAREPAGDISSAASRNAPVAQPEAKRLDEKKAHDNARKASPTGAPLSASPVALPTTPPPAPQRVMQDKREAAPPGAMSVAAGQAGAASTGKDTLAERLESERRKRASSEAMAADAASRPRIDAVGTTQLRNFSAVAKSRPSGADSLARAATPMGDLTRLPAGTTFDTLELTREPCFGRCPAYTLSVDRNGTVRYQSHHPDDTTHEQRAVLAAADLERLRGVIEQAHVETMPSYMPGSATCGLQTTDMPTLRLRVFERGRWYRVEQYQGCRAGTTVLPNLARQVDDIVGTQRWLPPGYRLN